MKTISLILALIFSFSVLGADATPIQKGTPTPYTGILLTTEKAEAIRIELIEKDQFALFNKTLLQNEERYVKIVKNQDIAISTLLEQNEKLAKSMDTDKSMTNFERMFWFGLGVAAAGFAVYGAASLANSR